MSPRAAFQRARKPKEKAQRREAILRAAAALFEKKGLQAVSLNAVARRAGIAKSNVYRYFETREAIFLALLLGDEEAWLAEVERALASLAGTDDPARVGAALAGTLADHPRLSALTAELSTALERNLSDEAVLGFKLRAHSFGTRVAEAIARALPSLPANTLEPLQRYLHAVVAGLYPIAHPAAAVARVLERPEMAAHRPAFREDLATMLGALLRGLMAGRV